MNISVLGSTGSIGTQTADIVRKNPDMKISGISAYSDILTAENQIREFAPKIACIVSEEKAKDLAVRVADTDTKIISGEEGLCEIAEMPESDTVVTATVGISGLIPTIRAIKAKKKIALANKETLVTGGHIVTALAKEYGAEIIPVDSEHSAVFQSLCGCKNHAEIKKIILTASGGPFAGKKRSELENITPEQALKHPNWNMGVKVTIDSSTMVNKGLEVIEARWLFDVPFDKIDVVIHRQSAVHSMVMFADNGIIAQIGYPDMRLPIQYALTYPNRRDMTENEFDFSDYPVFTFEKPDYETFKPLRLAFESGKRGGNMPCVFNSADEEAVGLFLRNKISYPGIGDLIEEALANVGFIENPSVSEILQTDKEAREFVKSRIF